MQKNTNLELDTSLDTETLFEVINIAEKEYLIKYEDTKEKKYIEKYQKANKLLRYFSIYKKRQKKFERSKNIYRTLIAFL